VRICRGQIEKAANSSPTLPAVVRTSSFMLFLACPPAYVDTHADPGNCIIWDGYRVFYPYAFAIVDQLIPIIEPVAVLLVIIVPQLVPLKYVSTTLGAHKSVSSIQFILMNALSMPFKARANGRSHHADISWTGT
jgi:hypothetical protein